MSAHITQCGRCRRGFHPGDRVVVAAIVPNSYCLQRADKDGNLMGALGNADFNLVHHDCADPRLGRLSMEIRRSVALSQCARCRLVIQASDRVVTCYIVQKVGIDPAKTSINPQTCLGDEIELAHADCRDPHLTGRLVSELQLPPAKAVS